MLLLPPARSCFKALNKLIDTISAQAGNCHDNFRSKGPDTNSQWLFQLQQYFLARGEDNLQPLHFGSAGFESHSMRLCYPSKATMRC